MRAGATSARSSSSRRRAEAARPRASGASASGAPRTRRRGHRWQGVLVRRGRTGGSGSSIGGSSSPSGDQPRSAAVGEERPRPAGQDDEAVREADQVAMWMPSQSSHAVKPPCWPNGPIHGMSVTPDSRPMTATSPWLLYRNGSYGRPRMRRRIDLRGVRPALDAALGDAGRRAVRFPRLHGRIADDEDLRVPRDRQVGPDDDPPGAVGLGAGRRRRPSARTRRRGRPRPTAPSWSGSSPRRHRVGGRRPARAARRCR